jgi:Family of unknown function (DUF6314)
MISSTTTSGSGSPGGGDVADTFEYLLGAWSVERTITDHRAGRQGSLRGITEVRLVTGDADSTGPTRARYEEVGHLQFGSYEGTARRSLVCVRLDATTVAFDFTDGRRFIECALYTPSWHAVHSCGEDLYELDFSVRSAAAYEERWRVRGPDTDYEANTRLRRLT